jgi:DNA invertase Pin-like site-specific DNA recombinase
MAKRAALYLRVSTGEQTTENQRRELEEVAQRSGWKIVAVYERAMISERVRAGLERVRANGPAKGKKAIGRPLC